MSVTLGYANQIDLATLSGGNWNASYPLNNIKTRYLYQRARTTNALVGSTALNIDLGSTQDIGTVAVVKHNLTADVATVRVSAASDSGYTSLVYDSGYITAYDGSDYCVVFDDIGARYWRIQINDTTNTDGYIEIGRVFIGPTFSAEDNCSWGYSRSIESYSQMVAALGGAEYPEIRPNRRVYRMAWEYLSDAEAVKLIRIKRTQDITGEVYFIFDDADSSMADEDRFLGRLRELSAVEAPYVGIHKAPFEVAELL